MDWETELRSQDMINMLQRSQAGCKGSVAIGATMEPFKKPILYLETRAILKERDHE